MRMRAGGHTHTDTRKHTHSEVRVFPFSFACAPLLSSLRYAARTLCSRLVAFLCFFIMENTYHVCLMCDACELFRSSLFVCVFALSKCRAVLASLTGFNNAQNDVYLVFCCFSPSPTYCCFLPFRKSRNVYRPPLYLVHRTFCPSCVCRCLSRSLVFSFRLSHSAVTLRRLIGATASVRMSSRARGTYQFHGCLLLFGGWRECQQVCACVCVC